MDFGKTEATVIIIGLLVFAAGIIFLLPSAPIEYDTDIEPEPGSFLFRGILDWTDDTQTHSIRILENPISMHIILKCGGNDFDLYVGFGYPPTTYEYEVRGFASGGEDFTYDEIEAGIWHFMVHSYSGSGAYELQIDIEY
jgi:hypothetical protein